MANMKSKKNISLTPVQQGMVFHQLSVGRDSGVDVEQIVADIRHTLDTDVFENCWREMIGVHDDLRAYVDLDSADPCLVTSEDVELDYQLLDWSAKQLTEERLEEEFENFLAADRASGFDIGQPLL